jgi:hypothetical protein
VILKNSLILYGYLHLALNGLKMFGYHKKMTLSFLLVLSACNATPAGQKKIAPQQQTTLLPPQTGGGAEGGEADGGVLIYARKQVSVTILQADELAARISGSELIVDFTVSGDGGDEVTLLCRSGPVPEVWRTSFRVCNGGRSHRLTGLKAAKTYGVGVVAQFAGSGRMSDEVSVTFAAGADLL